MDGGFDPTGLLYCCWPTLVSTNKTKHSACAETVSMYGTTVDGLSKEAPTDCRPSKQLWQTSSTERETALRAGNNRRKLLSDARWATT